MPKLQERKHRAIAKKNICTTREMYKPFQFSYKANSEIKRVRTQLEETDSYHWLCFSTNIVFDSIDYLSYLDHDDSGNRYMQIGVGVWPIIDLVNLDLNSKIPTTMYRKNGVKKCIAWLMECQQEQLKESRSTPIQIDGYQKDYGSYKAKTLSTAVNKKSEFYPPLVGHSGDACKIEAIKRNALRPCSPIVPPYA
ncbi:myb-like protein X [Vespula squamosa]|uniref:Myb-like protein X n=1 Tax=Vespula squamosa TaxID=30214 RepID=A0ABD2C251_VESSQ